VVTEIIRQYTHSNLLPPTLMYMHLQFYCGHFNPHVMTAVIWQLWSGLKTTLFTCVKFMLNTNYMSGGVVILNVIKVMLTVIKVMYRGV